MRWRFAVNSLHNCSLRPFCDDCSLNSFRTRCIPFLSLYRASLRVDEIRRNELSRFYFQPQPFLTRSFQSSPCLSDRSSPCSLRIFSRIFYFSISLVEFSSPFARKLGRYSLSERTAQTAVLSGIRLELRETWPECFSRIISSVTFRKIPLGYENEIISPFSVIIV